MATSEDPTGGRRQLREWAQMNCLSILVLWGICGILIMISSSDQSTWMRVGYGVAGVGLITFVMYMFREPWRSRDKRQHARLAAASIRVRVSGENWQSAQVAARDLSSGGLGITVFGMEPSLCERLELSHAVVKAEIDLPGEEVLPVSAIVVWSQPGTGGGPARMGLKFVGVDEDSREKIHGLVKWLAQGTGEARDFQPDDGV